MGININRNLIAYLRYEGVRIISRVADSTIKGFLYQFNLTLKTLFESTDSEIRVEGIVEDIDVIDNRGNKAIQCKYHESQEDFNLSTIYKPILQMLKTYSQNRDADILYRLYAYFPSLDQGERKITQEEIQLILNTTNIDYIANYIVYIKPCASPEILSLIQKKHKSLDEKKRIKDYYIQERPAVGCDINEFFQNKFLFEIGKSYADLEEEVKKYLIDEGLSESDVEEIFYPNAIQTIAETSMNSVDSERLINKLTLIQNLKNTKKTAITRWTKELSDYKKLLKVRLRQLSSNLNANSRKRCFIFDPCNIENFSDGIVLFIKDYVDIYSFKPRLHKPVIFCIQNYNKDDIDGMVSRLYSKGIEVETGYRGKGFFKEAFIRESEFKVNENWMQFRMRLCFFREEVFCVLKENKPDDIFIISKKTIDNIDLRDVNVELLDVSNFDELRYLLKITSEVK